MLEDIFLLILPDVTFQVRKLEASYNAAQKEYHTKDSYLRKIHMHTQTFTWLLSNPSPSKVFVGTEVSTLHKSQVPPITSKYACTKRHTS